MRRSIARGPPSGGECGIDAMNGDAWALVPAAAPGSAVARALRLVQRAPPSLAERVAGDGPALRWEDTITWDELMDVPAEVALARVRTAALGMLTARDLQELLAPDDPVAAALEEPGAWLAPGASAPWVRAQLAPEAPAAAPATAATRRAARPRARTPAQRADTRPAEKRGDARPTEKREVARATDKREVARAAPARQQPAPVAAEEAEADARAPVRPLIRL